jgi:imidazolonepropionase-like amidohydrolase
MRNHLLFFVLIASLGVATAKEPSPVPALPADIPATAVISTVLSTSNPAGQQATWKAPDGTLHVFFQFNDRGRGPKTTSIYRVDKRGLITSLQTTGNDYMKAPVEERFSIEKGTAHWKSRAENGELKAATSKFFNSLYGPPAEFALLVRAALANGGRLDLLPAGAVRIERVRDLELEGDDADTRAKLYSVVGLDLSPTLIWLDDKNEFFAYGSSWSMTIRQGFESSAPKLIEAQNEFSRARLNTLAKQLVKRSPGDMVIRNVSVFDPASGKVLKDRNVIVRGNLILSVDENTATRMPTAIDGTGKMLLPGLWDMHAHVSGNDPLLNIAAGVTTVRDLANDTEELLALRQRLDTFEQIGPRIIAAGFIDGPGPFQGPTKILAGTEEEARKYVAWYAGLGFPQIKIYSSLKPELVPVVIDEAHQRGMRVSGHIPAGMTAEQCVRLGLDEIQHMNMVFLNFMPDVRETRTPARFIEPGMRAAGIDLKSEPVQAFIRLLQEKHVVVDPTMTAWEGMYLDRPGVVGPTFTRVAHRMPAQLQRGLRSGGGLPITPENDTRYQESYANMKRMLKELYDGGVQLVAGTDNFAGFSLHRELEIYSEAGIPNAAVLRMATLDSARVMKKDKDFGSIESGKVADLILVDGDPTQNMADIRKVSLVIKDGVMIDPAAVYRFLGVSPQ